MSYIGEIAGLLASCFFAASVVITTKAGRQIGSTLSSRARILLTVIVFALAGCGPAATEVPTEPPATVPPEITPAAPLAMESIDAVLRGPDSGHLAYNSPEYLQLDETANIQLLLSPVLTPEELKEQIVESGQLVAAEVEVTPLMKAVLQPADPQAFIIQDLHDDPVQLILTSEPTEWRWAVTARRSGEQVIILSVYRLVRYEGTDYWRLIKTYESRIRVYVTFPQRLERIDWQWVIGIVLTLLSIPAIWGFLERKKNKRGRGKTR